jgi:hypothetical protein
MNQHEKDLRATLERLENSTRKVIETRGYSKDAKNLKLLEETLREQLNNSNNGANANANANLSHSTRTIR